MISSSAPMTRIAPTPSGFLHEGNLFNFMLTWLWARSRKGKILLRIDDADAERTRPSYMDDIFRTLEWMGIDWDLGPEGPDEVERQWSQRHRRDLYAGVFEDIRKSGSLFACHCTRTRPTGEDGRSCACRTFHSSLQTPTAWKFDPGNQSPVRFTDRVMGEVSIPVAPVVIQKKDGEPAYHLCSLADDRHFGITQVVRGSDLLESTAAQLLLDQQLGGPVFSKADFWHHALLESEPGVKCSKSAGHQAVSLRETTSPDKISHRFFHWLGEVAPAGMDWKALQDHPYFRN